MNQFEELLKNWRRNDEQTRRAGWGPGGLSPYSDGVVTRKNNKLVMTTSGDWWRPRIFEITNSKIETATKDQIHSLMLALGEPSMSAWSGTSAQYSDAKAEDIIIQWLDSL